MVKVANLYYKDNLKQESISKKLKISKYQVNRILKRAVGSGIIQINIIDPASSISNLEERLEKKFNLKRAVDSKKMHDLLINETSIKKTFEYFSKLTIAIVGIGAMYPKIISTLVKAGHISNHDLESLKKSKAAGDVYSHFFDINGKICDSNFSGRLVAMPVEDLLKVPYSVGIAGGKLKAEAILGAIRGNYINTIITDSTAAEKILRIS